MVKLITNEELETVTKSLQKIDTYVHQELGDEYDIDGFGRFRLLRWNSKKPKSNF